MDEKQIFNLFLQDYAKIREAFLAKEKEEGGDIKNTDPLGDKKALAQGISVRIKNAMLIYPRLDLSQLDDDTSNKPNTVLAVPKDKEVAREVKKAFENAYNYGISKKKVSGKISIEEMWRRSHPFMPIEGVLPEYLTEEERQERLEGLNNLIPEDYIILKNVKSGIGEDGKPEVVLRNVDGSLLKDGDMVTMGEMGDVVINFGAYTYQKKEGVGRYIQGFKRNSEQSQKADIWI